MFTERMAFALDGFGGPQCDPSIGALEQAHEYYNPFSNAIEFRRSRNTKPSVQSVVANSQALIDWLTASTGTLADNEQLVFEAIINGVSGWELKEGERVGRRVQYRKDNFDFFVEEVANRAINPCPFSNPFSITLGHTQSLDCGSGGAGQLAFLAATDEESTSRNIYGFFTELALPLSDTVDMQIAARFEDYGSSGGSSFDPKIAVAWNVTDRFKVRGSASTTFRGPPSSFLSGTSTALAFVPPALAFKALDTTGNADLEAEKATALNIGNFSN